MSAMHWPQSSLEWEEAVDNAVFALNWHAARLYGVVVGGPAVNVERCELIIEEARSRGVPIPDLPDVLRRYNIVPLRERRDTQGTVLDELGRQERGENRPDDDTPDLGVVV